MAELGKIERVSAEEFAGKKKLYCVPNIYPVRNADDEYNELFNTFWEDVLLQLEKLEAAGKIGKIFCESIYTQGDEALDVLARTHEKVHAIVRKKVDEGAVLIPVERREIFGPFLDWRNCLSVVKTAEVSDKILEFFMEVYDMRLQDIQDTIEANIAEGETGLLIIGEQDRARLKLSPDFEMFKVMPPSYESLLRWVREKLKRGTGQSSKSRHE